MKTDLLLNERKALLYLNSCSMNFEANIDFNLFNINEKNFQNFNFLDSVVFGTWCTQNNERYRYRIFMLFADNIDL